MVCIYNPQILSLTSEIKRIRQQVMRNDCQRVQTNIQLDRQICNSNIRQLQSILNITQYCENWQGKGTIRGRRWTIGKEGCVAWDKGQDVSPVPRHIQKLIRLAAESHFHTVDRNTSSDTPNGSRLAWGHTGAPTVCTALSFRVLRTHQHF